MKKEIIPLKGIDHTITKFFCVLIMVVERFSGLEISLRWVAQFLMILPYQIRYYLPL